MYDISNLRKDMLIELDGVPFKIISTEHNMMGRGGATLRTRLKNLLTGNVLEKTFRPADKISPASVSNRNAQYLYKEGSGYVFMDNESYEQYHVPAEVVGEKINYMVEGSEGQVQSSGGKVIDVVIPNNVVLKATDCEPGVKGNTATAATKVCTLETGVKVNVPLFIKTGDMLKVDTRTGAYLERAKE